MLTKTQKKVYDFVVDEYKKNGISPTLREICDNLNLASVSSAHYHISNLEKKGYISRIGTLSRNFVPVLQEDNDFTASEESTGAIKVPVIGVVAAGTPLYATQNIEGYFSVPSNYISYGSENFMLRISGNSMTDAGINNGDLVLVQRQATAEDGDIIIALIDDSATCKTFYKEKDFIRLQPENENYEPIYIKNILILGKVIGLFRMF
ncbi:MAG: transcriptional repressor LexA [Firmicutes bacterium]|nr:transcriptional repressor LexA [Bacillota bacterium]